MFKRSPLNYVGGKFRLLPQLKKIFPEKIDLFVDLFCGGLVVSLNTEAKQYIANDICQPMIDLFYYLRATEKDIIISAIETTMMQYGISETNKEGYLALRQSYNDNPDPVQLMVLISHSFNHQIRTNKKNQFNMPFGGSRCYFTKQMRANLLRLIDFLHEKDIVFYKKDFREFEFEGTEFVYCDPPYQHSTAVYNNSWGEQDDKDLLEFLDKANKRGCKFALSCVLLHNGIENTIIKGWAKNYNLHQMNWLYGNCNYQKKIRSPGVEACITNYTPGEGNLPTS